MQPRHDAQEGDFQPMSRFADLAHQWLREHAPDRKLTSKEFWEGMCASYPEITTPSAERKTPYNTLIRDMRLDPQKRFIVGGGFVELKEP